MRNLKRALSLALASVMLVGMMVVGTSAASFPDVDEKDNVEAIEVLNAVEVMVGDNGDFRPDSEVTRYEMAVIMAKLVLGSEDAAKFSGTYPFTDVTDAEKEWVEPYLAACYSQGIISGRSATEFDGQATVSGQEAAAMMLRALGYEDLSKGTDPNVPDDWARPVVQQASKIGLFSNVGSNPKMAMSRNAVAQLALNTLEATVVTTERVGQDIQIGDVSIAGNLKYEPVYSKDDKIANALSGETEEIPTDGWTLQLGEKLYEGDLKKDKTSDNTDNFGRPLSYQWTMSGVNSNDPVYKQAKKADVTFVKDTKEDDVLKAIKGYYFCDPDANTKSGKVENKTSTATKDITIKGDPDVKEISASSVVVTEVKELAKNGKQVEIFANKDKVVTGIVVITYQVSEVERITTNSNGDVIYRLKNIGDKRIYADPDKVSENQVVLYGDVAEGDIVTVAMADKNVAHVYPTTSFTGVQTAYSGDKHTITVDGKTYDVGVGLSKVKVDGTKGNFPNSDDEATFYVDFNGFVVKSDAVATSNDYAIIDSIAAVTSDGVKGEKRVEAKLIFTDGTAEIVDITKINDLSMDSNNVKAVDEGDVKITMANKTMTSLELSKTASDNQALVGAIVEYIEDDDGYALTLRDTTDSTSSATFQPNGVYKITGDAEPKVIITNGKPSVTTENGTFTGRNDTIYVVKTRVNDKDTYNVYTGFAEVPTVKTTKNNGATVSYTRDKDGKVILIYVDAAKGTASNDSVGRVLYVTSNKTTAHGTSSKYYTITGIVDGDLDVELKTKDEKKFTSLVVGELYELTEDDDEYVTNAVKLGDDSTSSKFKPMFTMKEDGDATSGNLGEYIFDDDTLFVVINKKDNSVVGTTADDIKKDDKVYVKVVGGSSNNADILAEVVYAIQSGD